MAVRKFRSSWWVDFRWNGLRVRKRSPVNTRVGAAEYEARLRNRMLRGESLDIVECLRTTPTKPEPTFADFAEEWFATYVMANNKPSEQRKRRSVLRAHLMPWFGGQALHEIDAKSIEDFKAHQLDSKLARKTVNNHLAILVRALRCAVQWGQLDRVPPLQFLRVAPPPFKVLTENEVDLLLRDTSEQMWNMMIRVGLRTGLRRGELMALDWSDIDLQRRQLTVHHAASAGVITSPKTFHVRTVPLAGGIVEELERCARPAGLVFQSQKGQLCPEGTVEVAIRRICRRLGMRRIGWHTLRHTFATTLAAAGVPLHVVKELLGHANISMTMRYAHVAPSMLECAIRTLEGKGGFLPSALGQPAHNPIQAGQEIDTELWPQAA